MRHNDGMPLATAALLLPIVILGLAEVNLLNATDLDALEIINTGDSTMVLSSDGSVLLAEYTAVQSFGWGKQHLSSQW